MKILVIDDQPRNVASAHATLAGLDYTVVSTIKEAFEILDGEKRFDVLLTDLWLPRGSFRGAMHDGDSSETPIPAGLVFALRALNLDMKVAIVTDSNHHQDRLCSILDLVRHGKNTCTSDIVYVEARWCSPKPQEWDSGTEGKNWLKAIELAKFKLQP
jgi:CheY-like chemotaxis protein